MFEQARRRLALRYVALLLLVLAIFSAGLLAVLAIIIQPAFDIAPEIPSAEAGRQAYAAAVERIAVALLAVDLVLVVIVGGVAYYLADRTLRPIRDAHDRQRRFVADASHEMRNPLTAIRATAEAALASGPDVTPATQTAALLQIVDGADRLGRLADDLLLLAQSEDGLLAAKVEQLDLSVLVAEVVDHLPPAHDTTAGVQLRLGSDLVVQADEDQLRRLIVNLIDNAIRYGGEKGVAVTTREQDGRAVLEVRDSGPGIAAVDLPRIFEPFYRVQNDAAAPSGNGLGLAIARELAERNHGRISVVSVPGRGSTFRLELRLHVTFR